MFLIANVTVIPFKNLLKLLKREKLIVFSKFYFSNFFIENKIDCGNRFANRLQQRKFVNRNHFFHQNSIARLWQKHKARENEREKTYRGKVKQEKRKARQF